jgi:hypothetical protein
MRKSAAVGILAVGSASWGLASILMDERFEISWLT